MGTNNTIPYTLITTGPDTVNQCRKKINNFYCIALISNKIHILELNIINYFQRYTTMRLRSIADVVYRVYQKVINCRLHKYYCIRIFRFEQR